MSHSATTELQFGAEFQRPSNQLVSGAGIMPASLESLAMYLKAVSPHQGTTVLIQTKPALRTFPHTLSFLVYSFPSFRMSDFKLLENRCEDDSFVFSTISLCF